MQKYTSRSKFRESLGAECKNAQWSWSWVNHEDRIVYFGASDVHEQENSQLILGFSWARNRKGRVNSGYAEATHNIGLILDQFYSLYTFRQFEKVVDEDTGRVRITDFEQDLELRHLVKKRDGWHAVQTGDFVEWKEILQSQEEIVYIEGSKVPILKTRVERNARARAACLNFYGANCCICNFDFQKVYGNLGIDFIHVHHINPLSSSSGPRIVCPEKDLRPVCPNCHAMIHRNGENRSIEEIRSIISSYHHPSSV